MENTGIRQSVQGFSGCRQGAREGNYGSSSKSNGELELLKLRPCWRVCPGCFFAGGMRSQSCWALAVGAMIPTMFLPCWIICHSVAQNHSTQREQIPGSSFLHRDLFQKGSPKPLTRLGCQLLAWKLESPWKEFVFQRLRS